MIGPLKQTFSKEKQKSMHDNTSQALFSNKMVYAAPTATLLTNRERP